MGESTTVLKVGRPKGRAGWVPRIWARPWGGDPV